MFLNFTTAFEPLNPHIIALFGLPTLNDVVFPLIGLSFLTSVVLTGIFSCCIGRCFEEEYIYPELSFISELGGALGMFLGFSFLMFWDLIIVLLTALRPLF